MLRFVSVKEKVTAEIIVCTVLYQKNKCEDQTHCFPNINQKSTRRTQRDVTFTSIRVKGHDEPRLLLRFGSHPHMAVTKKDHRPVCGVMTASNSGKNTTAVLTVYGEICLKGGFLFLWRFIFFSSGGRKQRSVSCHFVTV